ncbi:MAG TPA: SDR family oxidoreductase [Gaiellaceae bacterium]|nr:SDR family oxidoreductase [Gaiellaceae bacterium]
MRHAGRRVRRPDRGHRRHQRGDAGDIRVAVVTGGSSGIGEATARLLAGRGWRCVLLARRPEPLAALAAELGGEAEPCDVGDRVQVEDVARRVGERHAAVHLLVNNAGVRGRGSFFEVPPELVEEVVRTNYLGSAWCTRAFLPLLERGAPADVVNVVSVAGLVAHGASGPYSASKHAQLAFSRAVAPELDARRIRVHAVCPGPVETPGFPQRTLLRRRLARRAVLRPEDVAEAILAAVERGRREVVVPRYLRLAGVAQALAPAAVGRLATRARGRP